MSKKKFVFTITMVIFLISALSVFSIVRDIKDPDSALLRSEQSFLFKPSKIKSSSDFTAQSGTRPPAWNVDKIELNKKNR